MSAYFAELSEQYTTRAWYIALRGTIALLVGLILLLIPVLTANVLFDLFAIGLIIDGGIQITPLLLGRITRRLWPQVLFRAVAEPAIGLLVLIHDGLALNVFGAILGVLLIFRGLLELIDFVDTPMRARHQRTLLLSSVLSAMMGIILLSSPFSGGYAFERLLGMYAIGIGGIHIIRAWRVSEEIKESEEHAHTLLSQIKMVPVVEGPEPEAVSDQVAQRPDDLTWTPASTGSRLDPAKYLRPIVLTPHPDDLEGFAGGLAFKLTAGAISVVFAGGDRGVWAPEYARMPKRDYIHVRLEESAEAARLLGAKEVIYLGYLDRAVECNEESIQKVLDLLRRHQPDLVASFEFYKWANPYPHPDHLAVGNIVRHAVARYEHNDRLDYLVTSTLLPNIVVDVTGVRRIKLEALACHTTQIGLNGVIFPFLEKFITRLWGAFNGVDFAEGYRLVDVPKMTQRLGAKRG
jgi:LmbE family N-acetylglucosaminyl deacetylase/uncharacterized membrane protein HdeD (DUF308 family)